MKKVFALTALLVLLLILAACTASSQVQPDATATELPPPVTSNTVLPTLTVPPTAAPSFTSTFIATLTSTFFPTDTSAPTASPTPTVDLTKAQVIELTNGFGGIRMILKIKGINVPYNMIMAGIKFSCTINDKYPDYLTCFGLSRPPLDQDITEAFLDPQTGQVVYQTKIFLSSASLPTQIPAGYANTNCPDRGKNVSCETECRITPNDGPCIVATCTDACGLYFSVQSCPADMKLPSPLCNPDQWAADEEKVRHPLGNSMARKLFLIVCLSLLLSACSASTPQPTVTPQPTAAPLPSSTPAPTCAASATAAPTLTAAPATATLPPTQTLPRCPRFHPPPRRLSTSCRSSPSTTPSAAIWWC